MELKINKGVIFKNEKKSSDRHPDYRGEINVNGERFEISLWINDSKSGKKYFSVQISEPYQKAEPPAGVYEKTGKLDRVPAPIEEQYNDSLPF